MRLVPAIAIALAVVATASSALAQDPPAPKSSTAAPAPKPKKVAKGKKKKQPAPRPLKDDATTADATPAPVTLPAPAPMQPDPAPPAPPATPVSQTSTTSATITSPADKDRIQKKEEDPTPPFSVSPLVGIASNEAYGFGFGVRAGYTLPEKIYIGGQFMFQMGPSMGDNASARSFYPSIEVGYDLHVAKGLVIRPYGGGGVMFNVLSFGDKSATLHSAAIYPGCVITYTIPKSPVFVGGDARLLLVPGAESLGNSIALYGSVGARF